MSTKEFPCSTVDLYDYLLANIQFENKEPYSAQFLIILKESAKLRIIGEKDLVESHMGAIEDCLKQGEKYENLNIDLDKKIATPLLWAYEHEYQIPGSEEFLHNLIKLFKVETSIVVSKVGKGASIQLLGVKVVSHNEVRMIAESFIEQVDYKSFQYGIDEHGEKLLDLDFKQRPDFYCDVVVVPREADFGVIYLLKD